MKRQRRIKSKVLIVGRVAWVQLTRGFVAVIDAADAELAARFAWRAIVKDNGNVYGRSQKAKTTLHAFLTGLIDVDHRNGMTLDCRRRNLRAATRHEQSRNRGVQRNKPIRFKGVYSGHSQRNPFDAAIYFDKKLRYLGCFPTAELAAKAYDKAARKHFREFGRYNFPRRGEVSAR